MCCCHWVSMYRMLAYRAEDISKRLVPHELYVREELEESVQFDVSSSVWGSCDGPTFSHLPPSLSLSLLASCFQSSCILPHLPPFPHYIYPPTTFLTLLSWPYPSPLLTFLHPRLSSLSSPHSSYPSCKHRWQKCVFWHGWSPLWSQYWWESNNGNED